STRSKVTVNYERLEFLRDAVLDFLVPVYWLERNQQASDCEVRQNIKIKRKQHSSWALCIELGLYQSLRHHKMDLNILKGEKAVERKALSWKGLKIPK
ncbi:hypothetical protein BGX20_006652, partial [Mortierella sp. AD010]